MRLRTLVCGFAVGTLSCSSHTPDLEQRSEPALVDSEVARATVDRIASRFATLREPVRDPALRLGGDSAIPAWSGAAAVELPTSADRAVRVRSTTSTVAVAFSLRGASEAPITTARGLVVYQAALAGADIIQRVQSSGVEDFLFFSERPSVEAVAYEVDVRQVDGVRFVSNTIEFLDRTGSPRLRIAPPYIVDSEGRVHPASLALEGCAHDTDPSAPWGRAVTGPASETCVVRVSWERVSYPALLDPAWTSTGSMAANRISHTATLLPSGRVLVTGGDNSSSGGFGTIHTPTSTAELFDGTTFAATGAMTSARTDHTATLLPSGKVLVTGTGGADLYEAGVFTKTGSTTASRTGHTATLLPTGKVLVAGGGTSTAELFDPLTGSSKATGPLAVVRSSHTASVLASGKVLIVGGTTPAGLLGTSTSLSTTEIFDGVDAFVAGPTLATAREEHAAVTYGSGVMVIGGRKVASGGTTQLGTTEVYDGVGFSPGKSLLVPRSALGAVVIPSGTLVVVGGTPSMTTTSTLTPSGFVDANPLIVGRYEHTTTVMAGGEIVAIGGCAGSSGISSTCTGTATAETLYRTRGAACTANDDCGTGHCVDGVCCDTSCAGACEACTASKKGSGVDGTCAPIADGGDPDKECAPQSCTAAVVTGAQVCNGAGACRASTTTSCGLYACSGPACATTCTSDAQCVAGAFCMGTTCVTDLTAGAACDRAAQCATGSCVDGVCCDLPCSGSCEACSAAKKGSGVDGVCGAMATDSVPKSACPTGTTACGADGLCDGTGKCRSFAKAGTPCGLTTCASGLVSGKVCKGDSALCVDSTGIACAPYGCDVTACKSTCSADADCDPSAYCTSTNTCAKRSDNGAACTTAHECSSGFCTDGVCCNSACAGQCESCSEAGTKGTCTAVSGAPRGGRAACDALSDDDCAKTQCDGVIHDKCAGYSNGTTTPCGTSTCTADKKFQKAGSCDGHGKCGVPEPLPCTPYVCDTTATSGCKTSCTADVDCMAGYTCSEGTCVQGASCNPDKTISMDKMGAETPCAPYLCGADGKCASTCTASDQCASGSICDTATKSCVPGDLPSESESSCGCRQPGTSRGSMAFSLLLAVTAAVLRRRRD